MKHKPFTIWKILLIALIIIFLAISVMISLQSVTGYAVSEVVNERANLFALVFFLFGIFGAALYLAKFKEQ